MSIPDPCSDLLVAIDHLEALGQPWAPAAVEAILQALDRLERRPFVLAPGKEPGLWWIGPAHAPVSRQVSHAGITIIWWAIAAPDDYRNYVENAGNAARNKIDRAVKWLYGLSDCVPLADAIREGRQVAGGWVVFREEEVTRPVRIITEHNP